MEKMENEIEIVNVNESRPNHEGEDYISTLPDAILARILSLLKLKQAAKTCILSKRWRHVWTFYQAVFDLDSTSDFRSTEQFTQTVYKILKKLVPQDITIDELRIRFRDSSDDLPINSLMSIATERRVKTLLLEFTESQIPASDLCYSYRFTSLVSLKLIRANISTQFVDSLICTAPALEILCIERAVHSFDSLKIDAITLRHLELRGNEIHTLEISAPNLQVFKFTVPSESMMNINFKNIPRLNKVSLFGWEATSNINHLQNLSAHVPRLKSLQIMINQDYPYFPMLKNLGELELKLYGDMYTDTFNCLKLLEACPVLRKVSIDFKCYMWGRGIDRYGGRLDHMRQLNLEFKYLKVLELNHYVNGPWLAEFVLCLVKSAPNLDKIILNQYKGKCLRFRVPPSVELVMF